MFRPQRRALIAAAAAACVMTTLPAHAADTIKIGLITALSGQSARAGESLTRGMTIAIDEINAKGGLLGGRKLELVRRDDEGNPAKGVLAARELIYKEKVAVLFGGLDTPVSMAIVPIANQEKVPFMGPWAAGTPITHNGANPNFAFRVSAVDEVVDKAMLQYAQKAFNASKPGLILVNNPWGESNEKGIVAAMAAKGGKPVGVEKFEANDVDVVPQLGRLKAAGADVLLMVGNVGPSAQVVKSLDRMGWKVPVVSHWGPAGGRFTELAGPNARNVHFVQTYSFFGAPSPVSTRVVNDLKAKYSDVKGPDDITPAVGVANAYDATQLAALAIARAGSTKGDAVREGFYKIDRYEGLIKTYVKPFSPQQHDALTENDYVWAQFIDNRIVPVKQ
ncbi:MULTISPECIES: ABC transporter substrate-binding protein [unclassified Cupriavidus]|jgi:branched-chain amino acid transport system substrate-binding protein|uniref:ABC transporter substrate-binding protein n=2 Tax=Cupriavidus TaxID=106589 RepID=UPI001C0065E0|nr:MULTISPECIES: ABC transporter substrate-binding protein [unclassified Cupriavidus]MCA3186594.1 ABC transporter substrate-binding protein [Cupriavidus sp.]MCA3190178.1 ABC transporter substrate-binding protein [Cupriavidus sp.]MCA3199671.1 ABC transporter substrate-binding protein [Cupriavidus sp.]MCA3205602.1 ABC transporter substrate-binding protein [Cupriavidus sp.]MCA3207113.1 ABC transporter substrate-binding protein [Cupriavidus sp.]